MMGKYHKNLMVVVLLLAGAISSIAQDTYSLKIRQDTLALELNESNQHQGYGELSKPEPANYDSKTHAARLEKFVDEVAACDTLSKAKKVEIAETYKAFLAEHRAVRDSLSDEDIRKCSKLKVRYQKAMARIFVNNTSDDVSDTAEGVGKSVSKFFKKTGKKIQGAIEGFKDN